MTTTHTHVSAEGDNVKRSAHTPGPWFVNGPWHIQAHGQQGDARPRIIAQVVNKHEPDAALIAAAPTMLSALELALGYLGVAKISNEAGAHIKIDQAVQVLKGALGKVEL